ncbi:ParB/RepB/Spo0J family partition protein [Oricola sp.]|uniref:ParB/RepB/Spo0J family partition protein n=1 Tax=Oricola sp. TaxID=1979950 RepID=UPI0025FC53EE|nr:ParB/RepB/Spo0J family partition protein [Oricola sp.]MCI5075585.1 ParB/RepB/Spo0J family partition protein [Oricola sp.]
MSKIETIALADIHVPEDRLRAVKEDFASLYAATLARGRSLPPIQVRRTPNAKGGKFTLIAGLHRLRGHEIAGLVEIRADIVKADAVEARKIEIEENLFVNGLSALERIDAVADYRRIFEEEFGEIDPKGGRPKNSAKLAEFPKRNLLGVVEDSQEGHFYARVSERLGLSRRSSERLCAIAKSLQSTLHDAIVGTPIEDNQSAIERLSKLPVRDQVKYASVLADNGGDLNAADLALAPKPKQSDTDKLRSRLIDTWGRIKPKARLEFVREHRTEIEAALAKLDAEAAS